MNRIHLLPDELISQIAAGEVIERPASAVKELVENSLDAEAGHIVIEIEDGGLRKIRVSDNGSGMTPDDARMAFMRHATSKIGTLEDLFQMRSLGFRGEALASIASIARISMRTRPNEDRVGTLVEINGGKDFACEECACQAGTDISVYGLFEHTPARKKYMKSERTEFGHIMDTIISSALSHPLTGFRLVRDGELTLDLPVNQTALDRIRTLFGNDTAEALIPVSYQQSNLIIGGFIGKPELARSGKKYQFLIVNGRSVEDRLIAHAVKEAFHSLLMHEKYPWYMLDISIDPKMVDNNVHPRKLEVKFVNSQEIYRVVFGAVSHALSKNTLNPKLETAACLSQELPPSMFQRHTEPERSFAPVSIFENEKFENENKDENLRLRPVAQIARSYIVAEGEEGLVLIDQHAAHERVRYERLMKELNDSQLVRQVLLTPVSLDMGADSVRLVADYAEDFAKLGFDMEPFGGSTYLLRSVPRGIEKREPERIVREIVSTLCEEKKSNVLKNVREALLTMIACRGAIKFGDTLTMPEMEALIRDMSETPNADHCPHGRPSIIKFSFNELESRFKRRNF